jgi:hypothetical protein
VDVGTAAVELALSVQMLATAVRRWIQGKKPGIVIEVLGEQVVVRREPDLPPGLVVIRDKEKVKVENLAMPATTVEDIEQALRVVRRWGSD